VTGVPDAVVSAISGVPAVGDLDQAFPLLTAGTARPVEVCLLSRTELRATAEHILLVSSSTRVARNLAETGRATLVAVAGNAAYYLALDLRRQLSEDGALAAEMAVSETRRDSLGVELLPMCFRVEARLRVEERWDRTTTLLDALATAGRP
jgi:hypothetical protein